MEYHSELESESEEKQIIPIWDDEEFTFLNIQFPLPYKFPNSYLVLNKVMSNIDAAPLRPYVQTYDSIKDPQSALGYIIRHFNIDRVSHIIWEYPKLKSKQVYYLTYIDTSQFTSSSMLYRCNHT